MRHIELRFGKRGVPISTHYFIISERREIPEYVKNAVALFQNHFPDISLLDPELAIKFYEGRHSGR